MPETETTVIPFDPHQWEESPTVVIEKFLSVQTGAVTVDMSNTDEISALAVQILLAARAALGIEKIAFSLEHVGDPLADALESLGVKHLAEGSA